MNFDSKGNSAEIGFGCFVSLCCCAETGMQTMVSAAASMQGCVRQVFM